MEQIARLEVKAAAALSGGRSGSREVGGEISKSRGRDAMAAAVKQHATRLRHQKGHSRAPGKAWTPWDVLPEDPMISRGSALSRAARHRQGSKAGLGASRDRQQGLRDFVELVAQAHQGDGQKDVQSGGKKGEGGGGRSAGFRHAAARGGGYGLHRREQHDGSSHSRDLLSGL